VLGTAALRRPLDVLRGLATSHVLDPRHAVIAALAPEAEWQWRGVFGRMARRHAAWVVAGSHLRLAASGELANASMVFDPDGKLVATTEKVNPVPGLEDGSRGALKLARGSASRLPVVDASGIGKLATLIGYDACTIPVSAHERWEPVAERLAARGGVDVVANPVASARVPAEHWAAAGLAASLAATRAARFGVVAQLAGGILDLRFAGTTEIVACAGGVVHSLARADERARGCAIHARVALGVDAIVSP
jgi:predicted amidohydrolase